MKGYRKQQAKRLAQIAGVGLLILLGVVVGAFSLFRFLFGIYG
jgi:hypothetical protein